MVLKPSDGSKQQPWFWIIGGPNGAGKSTWANSESRVKILGDIPILNPDHFASPYVSTPLSLIASGKRIFNEINNLTSKKKSFAIETTLSGTQYFRLAKQLKKNNWSIGSIYIGVEGEDVCVSRVEERKSEIPLPREKIKTRKPSQNPASESEIKGPQKAPIDDPSLTPQQSLKSYSISKRAFKTYKKIRTGDWKFSRQDLYNLFEKLGCRVDVSQGKGDHGKVSVPLNITIENIEGLVAVIPEFVRTGSLGQVPTLTVPNWDEKWDGRVPPYMAKSILKALDYLGASDETVHKNNETF